MNFRPLARKKQQLDTSQCIALLKNEPRGVLSVLGDGGYPYGLPLNHWYCEADGKIYFHSGKNGHKIDALSACDKASFCVYDSGYREEDAWALHIKSVIVFGRVEFVTDRQRALEISRQLSYKFTSDEGYIDNEIEKFGDAVLCFALVPEQICGKQVTES